MCVWVFVCVRLRSLLTIIDEYFLRHSVRLVSSLRPRFRPDQFTIFMELAQKQRRCWLKCPNDILTLCYLFKLTKPFEEPDVVGEIKLSYKLPAPVFLYDVEIGIRRDSLESAEYRLVSARSSLEIVISCDSRLSWRIKVGRITGKGFRNGHLVFIIAIIIIVIVQIPTIRYCAHTFANNCSPQVNAKIIRKYKNIQLA